MIDKILGAILGFGAATMFTKKNGNSFAKGGILSKDQEQEFNDWFNDGNAIKVADDEYVEQTTQWRKKFTLDELKTFFKKEFLSYNKGGSIYVKGGRLAKMHKDLKMGTEIEMEHKETIAKFKKEGMSDREVAMMIAADHLKEDPNYYKKMKKAGL